MSVIEHRSTSEDASARTSPLQMLVDVAADALARTCGCDVRRERGPRVVPLEDNYDRLRYPPADVSRDARYTRYVDDGHVSAAMPVQ